MRCPHKRKERHPSVGTVMLVLNLVFLALLAASSGQSGVPRYIPGEWIISDEFLQNDDADVKSLSVEESLWPDILSGVAGNMLLEDHSLLATPGPHAVEEQASDEKESVMWKILLVVTILLVSIVGCLSMVYYMCVWRGGRIHYQPQKQLYA